MKTMFSKNLALLSFILLLLFLTSCTKSNTLQQTDEFYINNHAEVLLNSTKWIIFSYSYELYEDSSYPEYQENKIDGAQAVVLTYKGAVGDINTTEIFNNWGIGKNDLGLLLVLFLEELNEEMHYKEMIVEIGNKVSEYLSAFEASNMVDLYFNTSYIHESDIDLRLISLYFAFLEFIYLNVYEYTSYDYYSFYDEYVDIQYEYFGLLPSEETSFFSNLPIWAWILIILAILFGSSNYVLPFLFSGLGSGSRFRISGKGGKSRGYWFKK